jgi:hypothetical protein
VVMAVAAAIRLMFFISSLYHPNPSDQTPGDRIFL